MDTASFVSLEVSGVRFCLILIGTNWNALQLNSALNLHVSYVSLVAYEQLSLYNIFKGMVLG